MVPPQRPTVAGPALWPFGAAFLSILAFWAVGAAFFDGYSLDLGSLEMPTPRHASVLLLWSLFGGAASVFLALGGARAVATRYGVERFAAEWSASRDRSWLLFGSLLAFLVPLGVRTLLLENAPLTDDETVYRFASQLLASGRLSAPSPPMKLFFDHTFLINDGRMYVTYFLGWPALAVPAIWLGLPGIMNAVYSAVALPALFLSLRRITSTGWAKAGIVLYLASPFLMVGAATELSHPSCLAALAWSFWFLLRSRDADSPVWSHAGLAACLAIAFFVRPLSALAIGFPLVCAWAWRLRSLPRPRAGLAVTAFVLPALIAAGLFLGVNHALHGSVVTTGYDAFARYAEANDYRFVTFSRDQPAVRFGMHSGGPIQALAHTAVALLRLNYDLFGWPSSLLLIFFAAGPAARLPAFMLLSFVIFHFFQADSGIDSFGPVHYFETALPILLLSIVGLAGWSRRDAGHGDLTRAAFASAFLAALIVTSWAGYVPVRFRALHHIADVVNAPLRVVEQAGLERAVIFAPWPFAPSCSTPPTRHFVFQRPISDPDLRDDIVWANHISVRSDQELMAHFPGRDGYILQREANCEPSLVALAGLAADAVPDGRVSANRTTGPSL